MQPRKLMEMSALSSLIGNIGKQKVAFDIAVQAAALECIGQSIVHRNITPAQQLLDVVGAHLKPTLVAHLEQFGNIAWMKSDKKLAFFQVKVDDKHVAAKILGVGGILLFSTDYAEKIEGTPWIEAKKAPEPKSVYDVEAEVETFIKRLVGIAKRGTELKHKELLDKLIDVKNRYSAETYLAKTKLAENPKADEAERVHANRVKLEQAGNNVDGKPASTEQVQGLAVHFNGAAAAA